MSVSAFTFCDTRLMPAYLTYYQANPRMLDMMSSSPAPSKDTDGAHRLGCVSNDLSSPVSADSDILARQFEFETTAAAADGVITLQSRLSLHT